MFAAIEAYAAGLQRQCARPWIGAERPVVDAQREAVVAADEFYSSLLVDQDFYDELVSGKGNIDNITLSYNFLHDSLKTSLWGSSDSDQLHTALSPYRSARHRRARTRARKLGHGQDRCLPGLSGWWSTITLACSSNSRLHAESQALQPIE